MIIFNTGFLFLILTLVLFSAITLLFLASEKGSVTVSTVSIIILLLLLTSLAISFAEGLTEDNLYDTICSKSQKEMRQVTCEKAGIKVVFDNGDIQYSFPGLENQDSNQTQ